jgi:hypothetical protein
VSEQGSNDPAMMARVQMLHSTQYAQWALYHYLLLLLLKFGRLLGKLGLLQRQQVAKAAM